MAILGGSGPVQGVVRFLQLTPERCLIEGTIDGLKPGLHGLHVHQFGDLTRNCNRQVLCHLLIASSSPQWCTHCAQGAVLSPVHTLTPGPLMYPQGLIQRPSLQMRKLRLQEVKWLVKRPWSMYMVEWGFEQESDLDTPACSRLTASKVAGDSWTERGQISMSQCVSPCHAMNCLLISVSLGSLLRARSHNQFLVPSNQSLAQNGPVC